MDFYEKIINASKRANLQNRNCDIISLVDTSFIEKVNLKFCKFVLGLSKQSVNIAARSELAQYPLEINIKIQALKFLSRILSSKINPLLYDAYCLSKSIHEKGTYSWYTFVENIAKTNNIDFNEIKLDNFDKEKEKFSKRIKLNLQEQFEISFFEKLRNSENSKLSLYSKIKKHIV